MRSIIYLDMYEGQSTLDLVYVFGKDENYPISTASTGIRRRELIVMDDSYEHAILMNLKMKKFKPISIGKYKHFHILAQDESLFLTTFDSAINPNKDAVSMFLGSNNTILFTKNRVILKSVAITTDHYPIIPNIRYEISDALLTQFMNMKPHLVIDYAEEFLRPPAIIDLVEEMCMAINRRFAALSGIKNTFVYIHSAVPRSLNVKVEVLYSAGQRLSLSCVNVNGILYEESYLSRFPNYVRINRNAATYEFIYNATGNVCTANHIQLYLGTFNPHLIHTYIGVVQSVVTKCREDNLVNVTTFRLPKVLLF